MHTLNQYEVEKVTGALKDCILEDEAVKNNIVIRTIFERLEQEAKNSNGPLDYSHFLDCPSPPAKKSSTAGKGQR